MAYLLGPSLQLLPLFQTDLPYSSQKVMRGHEDPGTQEKREDVCPLQEGEEVIDDQNIPMGMLGCAWPGFSAYMASFILYDFVFFCC